MSCKNGNCKDLEDDCNQMNVVYDTDTKVMTIRKKDILDEDYITEAKKYRIQTVGRYDADVVTLDEDKHIAIISIPALEKAFGVEVKEVKIK